MINETILKQAEALQGKMHDFIDVMKAQTPSLAYQDCVNVYLLYKLAELQSRVASGGTAIGPGCDAPFKL